MRRLLLGIWLCAALNAQQGDAARARIGLVLSGGGARGCAHVGVLQVLEELRIPVDCVVGTSMGSIIGGMYAYGYSPQELAAEVSRDGERLPWSRLLTDEPARRERSFRRKQEDLGFLVDLGLGWRDGELRLPKGLWQGQNLMLELLTVLVDAHDLESFDELRIPFRAVATDLANGQRVVLSKGSLPLALRASMSLPGVFAPAVVDGRELIDGGLVSNVPVDVARSLGVDRLIVVDIGTPLTATAVRSLVGVSAQTVQILTQQNVDVSIAALRAEDVLVRPELGDMDSSDFERAHEAIDLGRMAALAAAERLRPLSVDEGAYARFLERQRRQRGGVVRVQEVRVETIDGVLDEVVAAELESLTGEAFDAPALRERIDRVYGDGNFESVTFALAPGGGDERLLTVRGVDRSWGPTYLRFGMALEADLEGSSGFDLAAQMNRRELNSLGAEWRTTLTVGERTSLRTELFQPLQAGGPLFAAVYAAGAVFDVDGIDTAARRSALDVRAVEGGADLGVLLDRWGQLRVGFGRVLGDVEGLLAETPTDFAFDDAFVRVLFDVDTLDHARFPRTGVRGRVEWDLADAAIGAESDYQRLGAAVAAFASVDRTSLGVLARVDTELGGDQPVYRTSSLGGFARLSGLSRNALLGRHLGLTTLLLRHQVAGRHADVLGFPVYVGGTLEAGNAWERRGEAFGSWRLAGSAFVALDTPIGPLYCGYGLSEGGADSFYLLVGEVLR